MESYKGKADFWSWGLAKLGGSFVVIGLACYLINPYIQQVLKQYLVGGKLLNQGSLLTINKLPIEIGMLGGIILLVSLFSFFFLSYENTLSEVYVKLVENKIVKYLVGKSVYLLIISIFFMVFFFYYKGMNYFFIRDDYFYIKTVKEVSSWRDVIGFYGLNEFFTFYRPTGVLYFLVLSKLFGFNPVVYRASAILIHAMNGILLYLIVKNLYHDKLLGFLASFIFIIRFSHFYNVFWIAAWGAQCTLFCLLAFLFYLKSAKKKTFLLLSVLCFMISITIKEATLVFPILLVLYEWSARDFASLRTISIVDIIKKTVIYWIILFIYFGIRIAWFIKYFEVQKNQHMHTYMYLLTFNKTTLSNLINYIRFSFDGLFDPATILVVIFIAFIFFCLKYRHFIFADHHVIPYKRAIKYGTIWFFISLLPVLFFQLSSKSWMYLSQVGFSITVACIFHYFVSVARKYQSALAVFLVFIFCLLGFTNISYKTHDKIDTNNGMVSEGVSGRNYLHDMKSIYPKLPKGSTIYFIPNSNIMTERYFGLVTFNLLFQLFYDDYSLKTIYLSPGKMNELNIDNKKTFLVFVDRYHIYDQAKHLLRPSNNTAI